jgi:hypothetical protein
MNVHCGGNKKIIKLINKISQKPAWGRYSPMKKLA